MRTYKLHLLGCLAAFLVGAIGANGWAAEDSKASAGRAAAASVLVKSANVVKLEGAGVARVRRSKGVESTLAVGGVVNPGDRITTDSSATVELILGDGTLIRVAPNSEYSYVGITQDKASGLATWAFGLAKGGVRAVVEKGDTKKFVKFKINSPVGTMGVRGTHFLFLHDQDRGVSTLYTMEGEVMFGTRGADYRNDALFRLVRGGFFSTIRKAEKMAEEPRRFSVEDLVTMIKAAAGKGSGGGNVASGNSGVFAGIGELLLEEKNLGNVDSWNADELKKQITEYQTRLDEAQKLLGDVVQAQTKRKEIGMEYSGLSKDLADANSSLSKLNDLEKKAKAGGIEGVKAKRMLSEIQAKGVNAAEIQRMKEALAERSKALKKQFSSMENPGLSDSAWGSWDELERSVGAADQMNTQVSYESNSYAGSSGGGNCTEEQCFDVRECDSFLGIRYNCRNERRCRQIAVACPAPPAPAVAPPEYRNYANTGSASDGMENREGAVTATPSAQTPFQSGGHHQGDRDDDRQRSSGCRRYVPCSTPGCRGGTFVQESDPRRCEAGSVNLGSPGSDGRH